MQSFVNMLCKRPLVEMLISDVSAIEYKSVENVHSVDSSLGFSLQAQIKKDSK